MHWSIEQNQFGFVLFCGELLSSLVWWGKLCRPNPEVSQALAREMAKLKESEEGAFIPLRQYIDEQSSFFVAVEQQTHSIPGVQACQIASGARDPERGQRSPNNIYIL